MATDTYEINDEQWEVIKDMLPLERTNKPGRPCKTSNRNVLNGGLWIDHTGSQWNELPESTEKNQPFTNDSRPGKTMAYWNHFSLNSVKSVICKTYPSTAPRVKYTNTPQVQKGGF